MNWKLIFQLSLFGLAMAFATISWIPSGIEPFFWLVIFIFCAWRISQKAPGGYFLHGFLVSLVNSVWITAAHAAFFGAYITNHPQMAEMNAHLPMHDHPRRLMILVGPVFGVLFGLILGLFAFIASRLQRRKAIGL